MGADAFGDTEGGNQRSGQQHSGDGGEGADDDGQPDAVDALGQSRAQVADAEQSRNAGGGAVRKEDAQADHGLEHHGGDSQASQLGGAQMSDDGGVAQQEERFGYQGEEGRDGQTPDLSVDRSHWRNRS